MNKNLKPQNMRSKEEQRKIASMGGKASGEARRKRKALKEQMILLLELPVKDTKMRNEMARFGINEDDVDNNTRLVYSLLKKAFSGDVNAIKEIRSLIGEDTGADVIKRLDDIIQTLDDENQIQ